MLLSIVIPTYRRPALLQEILSVLATQATAEAEILIIDNDPDGSAQAVVNSAAVPRLRYIHETRRGISFVRNRGVAEACGTHLIFLDDDEIPGSGWLAAFAAQARADVTASFGRIMPRFAASTPPGLETLLVSLFSREARAETGDDISSLWPYLGTGNSLFHKGRCFPEAEPFDHRFNMTGGEDIWMIRTLMARGVRLIWNREALVEEVVPADRMTLSYLQRRKFSQGRQRVIFAYGRGGVKAALLAGFWMAVGAIQFGGYGVAALLFNLAGSSRREEALARRAAGLGKLLWWREAKSSLYA